MKNVMILLSLVLVTQVFGQEKRQIEKERNEVKLNASNLIAFQFMDLTYERLLDEDSSMGIGTLFYFGTDQSDSWDYRTFSLTPYFRQYFSNSHAKGFFVEGFGMFNSGNYNGDSNFFDSEERSFFDFALGISVGGKFVNKSGFIAEVYGGLGRNLSANEGAPEIVGRGGISVGFRF